MCTIPVPGSVLQVIASPSSQQTQSFLRIFTPNHTCESQVQECALGSALRRSLCPPAPGLSGRLHGPGLPRGSCTSPPIRHRGEQTGTGCRLQTEREKRRCPSKHRLWVSLHSQPTDSSILCERIEGLRASRKSCAVRAGHGSALQVCRSQRGAGGRHREPRLPDTEGSQPRPPHRATQRFSSCWCGTWRTERASKGPESGASLGRGCLDTQPAVLCRKCKAPYFISHFASSVDFHSSTEGHSSSCLVCGAERNTSFTKTPSTMATWAAESEWEASTQVGSPSIVTLQTALFPPRTQTQYTDFTQRRTLLREPLEHIRLPSAENPL